ncbi:MAG TPA: hypothetical protein VI670_14600 [Thermoanaerobaculia bacterium]|jgi:hypothetical protein
MSFRFLVVLLQLAFAASTYAAGILSVTSQAGSPVVSIDPATGTVQPLFNTNTSALAFGISAFDPASRRLYFLSGAQQLVIADLISSTVTTRSIAISGSYIFFEWDAANGRILAVTSQAGSPVVSIDPATGTVQSLFNTNAGSLAFGYSAFDPASRRLYFLTGAQQLVIADLNSSTVTTRSIAISGLYIFFEWDAASGRILAVTSQAGSPVVSIAPATGTVQPLFNTNAGSLAFGYSAFDPLSRRLYFLTGAQQLVIADLNTSTATTRSIAIASLYIFFELDAPAASIPTLGFLWLIVVAGAMAAIGYVRVAR